MFKINFETHYQVILILAFILITLHYSDVKIYQDIPTPSSVDRKGIRGNILPVSRGQLVGFR